MCCSKQFQRLKRITFVDSSLENDKMFRQNILERRLGALVVHSSEYAKSARMNLERTLTSRNRSLITIDKSLKVASWVANWGATVAEKRRNEKIVQLVKEFEK